MNYTETAITHSPYTREEWDGYKWIDCSCGKAGGQVEEHLKAVFQAVEA